MNKSSACRVTLPSEARRPFQVLRGLSHYPVPLTFDSSKITAIPALKRRSRLIAGDVVRKFLRGGPANEMWLKGAVEGKLDLEKVPAELWEEMNLRAELSFASRSKRLSLTLEEIANLTALGFKVLPERATEPPKEETSE